MNVRCLNLLATYHKANAAEICDGQLWYRDRNCEANRLAEENGLTIRQTAGIIAAVSPGLRWEKNVECAERIIRGESLNGLGVRWYNGVRKAERILAGHDPDVVLKGNKVRAFASCIVNPSDSVAVCIDGHAYAIWCGRRIPLDDVPPLNNRLYHRIAGDYVFVAKVLSIRPCQLQAVTWCCWRRLHNVV